MKIRICIAALIAIFLTPAASAKHRHGSNNACWYETDYGKKKNGENWAYYYCGAQYAKCDGKTSKGHDKVFWHYHGDSFTFKSSPTDTYFCCGGTTSTAGKYVRADKWIVKTETEKVSVAGGTCNKSIETDACGAQHITECTKPDNCDNGTILRNGECVVRCEGDEVFESTTSNKCIACETTLRQGPSKDHTTCIKCDSATEFFNSETKTCIKKNSPDLTKYTKESMQECWRCPHELFRKCVESVTTVNKMGVSDKRRLKEIDAIAAFTDNISIVKKCHLGE